MVDRFLADCPTCAAHNRRKAPPIAAIPVPDGLFRQIVMDFIDMGEDRKAQGKRYMLVIINRFSRWIKATATAKSDAQAVVAKFLIKEVIPRFGVPDSISSINGPHFVNATIQLLTKRMGIKHRLGFVYHPQSQGMVERANGTLKLRLAKMCWDLCADGKLK